MASIVALFVITAVSLLLIRFGATALMMTGLNWDTASFQACSAFFGVGFTTSEAEMVVNHPIRRRIITNLIVAGNVGLTSGLATLIATVLQDDKHFRPLLVVGLLVGSIALLVLLFRIGWIQKIIDRIIQNALKRMGLVRALDYELLLRIRSGFCVSEIEILPDTCLVDKILKVSRPADWGVLIMAISRGGGVMPGLPGPRTVIQAGDVITAYGQEKDLKKILHPTLPPFDDEPG